MQTEAQKKNRFSKTNRPDPENMKGKRGPQLTALLRKLLEKKISYKDPETQKIVRGCVKDAVLWRLICNATQGETKAIEQIIDRMDGKVKGDKDGDTNINVTIMPIVKVDNKELRYDFSD